MPEYRERAEVYLARFDGTPTRHATIADADQLAAAFGEVAREVNRKWSKLRDVETKAYTEEVQGLRAERVDAHERAEKAEAEAEKAHEAIDLLDVDDPLWIEETAATIKALRAELAALKQHIHPQHGKYTMYEELAVDLANVERERDRYKAEAEDLKDFIVTRRDIALQQLSRWTRGETAIGNLRGPRWLQRDDSGSGEIERLKAEAEGLGELRLAFSALRERWHMLEAWCRRDTRIPSEVLESVARAHPLPEPPNTGGAPPTDKEGKVK